MFVRILSATDDLRAYDAWVRSHPHGSLWQSTEWKAYQEALGRETRLYVGTDRGGGPIRASALISIDRTAGGYSAWDIGRGPLWDNRFDVDDAHSFFTWIQAEAHADRCIQIFCSPASWLAVPNTDDLTTGHPSRRHVYPEATTVIDLTKPEETMLAAMHPKGRYNIGVAAKHGVTIRKGSERDINTFYELLKGTGGRDGFKISQQSHYTRFLSHLEGSFFLLATHEGKPIAGLIGVIWPPPSPDGRGGRACLPAGRGEGAVGIYYYGASSYAHRNLMAPYLLQWEAMKHCKAAGCNRYDLLGISPENAPANDPWRGITDFKRKFGGSVVTYPHERMIVLRPIVKWGLDMKRRMLG